MNTSTNEQWLNLYKKQSSKSFEKNKKKSANQLCTYFFIFDCDENKILFINSNFSKITGHNTNNFNVEYLIDIIHPDDKSYFFEKEEQGLEFTNKLKFNEHYRYTIKYTYRIKKIDGTYIRISQECQAIEVNESGHLTKTLVTHKVLNDSSTTTNDQDYKIFDKLHSIYLDLENKYNLTSRELEILTLIKQGLTSKQISHTLHISHNTICTHRKNILYKTNSNSFIELVKKLTCAEY